MFALCGDGVMGDRTGPEVLVGTRYLLIWWGEGGFPPVEWDRKPAEWPHPFDDLIPAMQSVASALANGPQEVTWEGVGTFEIRHSQDGSVSFSLQLCEDFYTKLQPIADTCYLRSADRNRQESDASL